MCLLAHVFFVGVCVCVCVCVCDEQLVARLTRFASPVRYCHVRHVPHLKISFQVTEVHAWMP